MNDVTLDEFLTILRSVNDGRSVATPQEVVHAACVYLEAKLPTLKGAERNRLITVTSLFIGRVMLLDLMGLPFSEGFDNDTIQRTVERPSRY